MNIVNNIYYDLASTVKVVGILPVTFNKELNLENCDLLVIENNCGNLQLVIGTNKDKILNNAWRANIDV